VRNQTKAPAAIAEQWKQGSTRAAREALAAGNSHGRIASAQGLLSPHVRTLTPRADGRVQVTLLPEEIARIGVEPGGQFVFDDPRKCPVGVRPVQDGDLDELARAAVERANRFLPTSPAWQKVRQFPKQCAECGQSFIARRAYTKCCPPCRQDRAKAQKRTYNLAQQRAHKEAMAAAKQGANAPALDLSAFPPSPIPVTVELATEKYKAGIAPYAEQNARRDLGPKGDPGDPWNYDRMIRVGEERQALRLKLAAAKDRKEENAGAAEPADLSASALSANDRGEVE